MTERVNGNLPGIFLTGTVAERLRAAMRERKIGADRLGEVSGISPRLIRKYRAGTVEPRDSWGDPTDNARLLANALEVSIDDLVPPARAQEAA